MRHWACKREKYTFINANIKVINTILKVNSGGCTAKCPANEGETCIFALLVAVLRKWMRIFS